MGVEVELHRQLVSHHRMEILEVCNDQVCILVVVRNWINPLFQTELSRIKTALDRMTKKLAKKHTQVWKYLIVPNTEKGQMTLDAFGDLHVYPMPYLRPPGIDEWLKQEAGCEYSAYTAESYWPQQLVELLQFTWRRLLRVSERNDVCNSIKQTHTETNTNKHTETQTQDTAPDMGVRLQRRIRPAPILYSIYIVTIRRSIIDWFRSYTFSIGASPIVRSLCVFLR